MITARKLVPLLACAIVAATSCVAAAATRKEQARVEVEKAELQYKLGRFQDALDAYARAYELYPAPALLFDIGQCHKNLKDHERAIFFFEGYLREEASPAKRKLAEELLAESRAELERQQHATAAAGAAEAPATGPPLPAAPAPAPAAAPPVALIAAPPAPVDPQPQPAAHRWWLWTAVGAGLLAAAGGAFVYYRSAGTTAVLPGGTLGTLDRR